MEKPLYEVAPKSTPQSLAVEWIKTSWGEDAVVVRCTDPSLMKASTVPAFWIIDTSGSMVNDIRVLNAVLKSAYNAAAVKPVVIRFATDAEEIKSCNEGKWRDLTSGGGTSFTNAFIQLMDSVTSRKLSAKEGANVLFFTDGCDQSGFFPQGTKRPAPFLVQVLHPYLKEHGLNLHIIGFGRDHDLDAMAALIRTKSGDSYQYSPGQSHLEESVGAFQSLSLPSVKFTIAVEGSAAQDYRVSSIEEIIVVPVTTCKSDSISVVVEGQRLVIVEHRTATPTESLRCVQRTLQELSKAAPAIDGEKLKKCDERLEIVKKEGFMVLAKRREERKTLLSEALAASDLVSALFATLRGATDMETRAKLLSAGSAIRTGKRGLDKRLDQRVIEQGDLPRKIEADAKKASAGFPSKDKEDAEEFVCPLTASNYCDAARDGDCMCLTLQVDRPAASVAEPALIRIVQVNYDCMTLSGFKDALLAGLLTNAEDDAQEDIHGGFLKPHVDVGPKEEKTARPSVIRDRLIKPCNAVLPLFICDEHWAVAQHWLKAALGFITCVDERAYHPSQMHTIPFLVLEWMERTPPAKRTAHFERYLKQVLFVCQFVSHTMKDQKPPLTLLSLCLPPTYALTKQEVANLKVLYGRLLTCDRTSTWKREVQRQAPYLLLEHWRRAVLTPALKRKEIKGGILLAEQSGMKTKIEFAFDIYAVGPDNGISRSSYTAPPAILIDAESRLLSGPISSVAPHFLHMEEILTQWFSMMPIFTGKSSDHKLAYYLWAYSRCQSEDPVSAPEIFATLDPLTRPRECIHALLSEAFKEAHADEAGRFSSRQTDMDVANYIRSPSAVWTCSGHLFGGHGFGRMLKQVRALRRSPGAVINAKDKLTYLMHHFAWTPSNRNRSAFQVHYHE